MSNEPRDELLDDQGARRADKIDSKPTRKAPSASGATVARERGPRQVPADDEKIKDFKILPMAGTPGVVETLEGTIVPTIDHGPFGDGQFVEPDVEATALAATDETVDDGAVAPVDDPVAVEDADLVEDEPVGAEDVADDVIDETLADDDVLDDDLTDEEPEPRRFVEDPAAARNRRIAWVAVGLMSLVSLVLGIVVLMGRIEMDRWVGIAFLSLGIMGLMLLALPLFVNPIAQAAMDGEPRGADGRLNR